mmetsp:Transcript_23051/g.56327  ORF Transcript_23051/g.56327 Transcript_23051/m.56327 type:complete len:305 (+) Transcript_23051:626-1540(+)
MCEFHAEYGWYYDPQTMYYVVDLEKRRFYDGATRTYLEYQVDAKRYVAYDPEKVDDKAADEKDKKDDESTLQEKPEKQGDLDTTATDENTAAPDAAATEAQPPVRSGTTTSGAAPRPGKVLVDLERWKRRQEVARKEARLETPTEPPDAAPTGPTTADALVDEKAPNDAKPHGLVGSKPSAATVFICELCRRKFKSGEMLQKHEKLSELHKKNMAEREAKAKAYRDRAQERKDMFPSDEEDEELLEKNIEREKKRRKASKEEQPVDPLGEGNVGNKLLQAMGWKAGEGLGKYALRCRVAFLCCG